MIKYLLKKIAEWIILIFLAVNMTYFLAQSFLFPRSIHLMKQPPPPEAEIDEMLNRYNLNDKVPFIERWWNWLTDILTKWDWGYSPAGASVAGEVADRFLVSAQLLLGAFVIALVIGVAIGVYTASRQYQLSDRIFQGLSVVAMNIHIAVMASAIVLLGTSINGLARSLSGDSSFNLFYVTGMMTPGVEGFFPVLLDRLQHLFLPTLTLVLLSYAGTHFTMRSLLLDNIAADYVRTARAKGLTKARAVSKHALRTSLIPVAVGAAFGLPAIFTGAVVTETIFAWQGMGQYFVKAIGNSDIHGVVVTAAFGAVTTAVGALLADVVVVFLDPRVRVS